MRIQLVRWQLVSLEYCRSSHSTCGAGENRVGLSEVGLSVVLSVGCWLVVQLRASPGGAAAL